MEDTLAKIRMILIEELITNARKEEATGVGRRYLSRLNEGMRELPKRSVLIEWLCLKQTGERITMLIHEGNGCINRHVSK